MTYSKFGQVLG